MITLIPDEHKAKHLFLLVGENPLPNYVAAKLLLNQGGTIYLVYTTGTENQANRLQTILSNEGIGTTQFIPLNNYESDAYHIQEEICRKLETIREGKLGLNYTGGTKAMAVHAYRALFSKARPDTVFSYLDPRRLEMCIDRENGDRRRFKVEPDVLQVELAKVFKLHGWNWGSEPTYESELPNAAQAFAQFHAHEELVKLWRDWCDKILRAVTRDHRDKWLSENRLKVLKDRDVPALSLDKLKSSEEINSALTYLGVTGKDLSLEAVKDKGLDSLTSACKWLDGEWLEYYVLQQVQKISQEWSIHDSATSFWIRNPIDTGNTKFQFDVAFMRGYQLFAISCTTIDRKFDCKSKLFEAYIRAQQLGGSEARVALVCCVSERDDKALETEIVNVFNPEPESGERNHKVAVFGRDDLINLSDKIDEWIKWNDREAK